MEKIFCIRSKVIYLVSENMRIEGLGKENYLKLLALNLSMINSSSSDQHLKKIT